jgi:shikimate dehydrogenase
MNKYGLLGKKLSHSYSKKLHNIIFKLLNSNDSYDLLEIEENELNDTINLIKNKEYSGFNVTIPYKELVIPYLDILTDSAKEIKAVNTIYLKDGLVCGDNTDYIGFSNMLKKYDLVKKDKIYYILGSGGASKAVRYALKKLGLKYFIVSRKNEDSFISYNDLDINNDSIIINTTPLGMYPNILASPLDEASSKKAFAIVDLIFNPKKTLLMSYNKNSYNGLYMLVSQGIESENLWKNIKIKDEDFIYNKLMEELNE